MQFYKTVALLHFKSVFLDSNTIPPFVVSSTNGLLFWGRKFVSFDIELFQWPMFFVDLLCIVASIDLTNLFK